MDSADGSIDRPTAVLTTPPHDQTLPPPHRNEAPDTKVPSPQAEEANAKGPEPSKPPSLFNEESFSYLSNLIGLLRTNSAQDNKAQADAGAAASGDQGGEVELPPNFPQSYLGFCKGDKRKALDLYNHGQALRQELGLDNLDAPPAFFNELQQHYPLALHGRSKAGEVVLVQSPGKMDVGQLKAMGVQRKDVVHYFMYHLEYMVQRVDPNAKVLMVVDMTDLGMGKMLNGDFLATVRTVSDSISSIYCRRVARYVVAQPPAIFEKIWSILSTVLPAGARDNCVFAKDAAALEVCRCGLTWVGLTWIGVG